MGEGCCSAVHTHELELNTAPLLRASGVPLGNGRNLGLVRSHIHNGPAGLGGDTSRTGVPNAFSVDGSGDGKLDVLNPKASRARSPPASPPAADFPIFSQLLVPFSDSANADAANIGAAAGRRRNGQVAVAVRAGAPRRQDRARLRCAYVLLIRRHRSSVRIAGHRGAAAVLAVDSRMQLQRGSCLPGAGQQTRRPAAVGNSTPAIAFALLPEAPSSKIGSGDVPVQRVTTGGLASDVPGTVKFVFTSEPALQSWSLGSDSASVTYPVAANAPGTTANPWQIGGGAGDVVLKFTFWRPQRAGITGAGEAPSMGIGHLHYISRPVVRAPGGKRPQLPPIKLLDNRPEDGHWLRRAGGFRR